MKRRCGFVPFPGSGAYGHWACERRRHHLGRHRFVNYTIARIPRVWRARRLWRLWRLKRMVPSISGSYRRLLYPTKYQPVR